MIARRNSWRHGLSTVHRDNPVYAQEIADIARAICGQDNHPLLVRQAIIIAECEVLTRYTLAQITATLTLNPNISFENSGALADEFSCRPAIERDEWRAMWAALRYLKRLDRYQLRAWSRRYRAIKCFYDTRDYLRAIVSPETPSEPGTFDPKTGHYIVRLSQPNWPDQVLSNQYLSRTAARPHEKTKQRK